MAESGTAPRSGRTMPPGWEGEGRRGHRGGGREEEGQGRREGEKVGGRRRENGRVKRYNKGER